MESARQFDCLSERVLDELFWGIWSDEIWNEQLNWSESWDAFKIADVFSVLARRSEFSWSGLRSALTLRL